MVFGYFFSWISFGTSCRGRVLLLLLLLLFL